MSQETEAASFDNHLRELGGVLNKDDGIVNTSSAHRFLAQPADIEAEYKKYAQTHALQPDIERFLEALIGALDDPDIQKSVPGYIFGPYGFGKTSTAGKVWYVLETDHEYIATPPIYFDELQSIVDAVYGWMRYRLQDRPDYLEELEDAYRQKTTDSVDDLVDQTEVSDKDRLRKDFQELIEAGEIDIEFSVTHVLNFLSECNQIAKDAGYAGLVVIADELQQFVSGHSSDKEAYSDLRDIAKNIALGLNEGDGLGLLFTMDDGQHSDLDVNADDVLARLAEQNVKLNLANVYGRDFPTTLWDELSEKFGFSDRRHDVISEDALDAIGQICERGPPLSNGPRTVVDLFTIAIDHRLTENDVFDALALATAYQNNRVRFKGDHINKAITEALNSELVNTPDHENFIKLCGVFPRGTPDNLLRKYGVIQAKEDLKNELHGQIIIIHEEGRTLKRLERGDEDRGLKDELFTQFYRDYDTTDVYDENAGQVFREQILENELFPATRGKNLSSWVTEHKYNPETGRVYTAIFRGSFDGQEYPERIIEIRTGPTREAVKTSAEGYDVDLTMGFVCLMDEETTIGPHIERPATDEVIFYLDFTDVYDSLPSNIALLKDYMSPEDVNPHLLLCLYHFMDSWEEKRTINPNQEDQLDYIKDQLINRSIQKLFGSPLNSDEMVSEGGSSRRATQAREIIPTVFNNVIQNIYPDYTTLFISDNYETFLEDYESMIVGNDPELRISQKRGNTPIEGTKDDIANALGVSNNSTAKTRLDKQFATLVDVEVWSGQDARIRLTTHPLEDLLKTRLENDSDEELTYQESYEIAQEKGYRSEEVDWALRLLDGREYIDRDQEQEIVTLSDIAIDYASVESRFREIRDRIDQISDLSESWDIEDELMDQLQQIEEDLAETSEDEIETLDRILGDLTELETELDNQEHAIHARYIERCRGTKETLQEIASATEPRELNQSATESNVPFSMHLADIQSELESDFEDVQRKAGEAEEELRHEIDSAKNETSIDAILTLRRAYETAQEHREEFEEEIETIETKATDYEEWCDLAIEMGDTRERMVTYRNSRSEASRVNSLIEGLDQQLNTIQKEFQTDDDEMLRNAGVNREQFKGIKEEFEGITETDEQIFLYRRNVLKNTLREATDGHPAIHQNPSPSNPQESRKNLYREFKRKLQENDGGLEDIREELERVENGLGYAELLQQVPADPAHTPAEIEDQLAEIRTKLETVETAVDEMSVYDDIPLPDEDERAESFPHADSELELVINDDRQAVGQFIDQLRSQLDDLNEVVNKWRKSTERPPDDLSYIMDQLDYRERTDIERILISISEDHDDDLDLETFFADLQVLFEENHITILVESEHR